MGKLKSTQTGIADNDTWDVLDGMFHNYYRSINQFVLWMVQDKNIAEDLTQETFLKAYFSLDNLQDDSKMYRWLHSIARNLCIDYWRKSRRKIDELSLCDSFPENIAEADDVGYFLENKEIRELTRRALMTLKHEHQTALLLRESEEMTYEEAAHTMGISMSAFTSLLNRARERFARTFFEMAYPQVKDRCFGPKEYSTLLKWVETLDDPHIAKKTILDRTRAFFDQSAESFDDRRERHYPRTIFEMLSANIEFNNEMVAVDLGAATGAIAERLGHRIRKVYALDLSPLMLKAASKRFERSGLLNVASLESDVAQIPLPDESIDLAYSILLIHHLFDPEESIREIARVVRKGGKVLIADFGVHDFAWLRQENSDVWSGFKPDQLAGWLKKAGLESVWVKKLTDQCFYYPEKNACVPLVIAGATKKS